jgi:molecular chaperone DnaK
VQAAIDELKTALEGTDIEEIKTKTDELQTASYKIGEIVYQNMQEEAGEGQGSEEGSEEAGDTIEADYEVVDDDKQ